MKVVTEVNGGGGRGGGLEAVLTPTGNARLLLR